MAMPDTSNDTKPDDTSPDDAGDDDLDPDLERAVDRIMARREGSFLEALDERFSKLAPSKDDDDDDGHDGPGGRTPDRVHPWFKRRGGR